ncbi:hypothetical protein BGZ75_008361 [Mortierella antarctica]|uniref:Uncharacterized protein n=1 Tax=Mortierella alpina TaxID=64518 RepID=A0A9P8D1E1_MORAP|nr:hypothetical protein BGZ75_008361 [Mortierella antarctica]KAG9323185.1 hypothetical protein KVV02_001816 [Mortierella alpina]
MNAFATSTRLVRAPLQAAARRQYSAAASSGATPAVGHSNQRLAIASGVSAVVGADITWAYFTFFKKEKSA